MLAPSLKQGHLRVIIIGLGCLSLLGFLVFPFAYSETDERIQDQETLAALGKGKGEKEKGSGVFY